MQASISELAKSITADKQEEETLTAELEMRKVQITDSTERTKQARKEKDGFIEQRKEQWRGLKQISDQQESLKEKLARGENELRSTIPRHISKGLEAIKTMQEVMCICLWVSFSRGLFYFILQKEQISGVYGPLIELFQPSNAKVCTTFFFFFF